MRNKSAARPAEPPGREGQGASINVSEQPATEPQVTIEEVNIEEVNIEEIMQQIRQQIIARRAAVGVGAGGSAGAAPVVTGRRYPPEFYEHLYQARLALDEVAVPVFVSKSGVPIIGGVLVWLRTKIHELVAYYVNLSAARQASAAEHLLQALSLVGQEAPADDDR